MTCKGFREFEAIADSSGWKYPQGHGHAVATAFWHEGGLHG
jgi:hypothetical protein